MARLESPPPFRWEKQNGPIQSLFYSGETYQGRGTEVFAFYASPATVSGEAIPESGFPGIVLIHGGGGTAFADWVMLWAKRGYAAIAMDLGGCQTQDPVWIKSGGGNIPMHASKPEMRTRLSNGGPDQGNKEKYGSIVSDDVHEHWSYHAVANVIRAHSLLRSLPEVNAERTAVTGISWGGYTACIAASVDRRFKAAVTVYGCGFLFEGESAQKAWIDNLGDLREKWIRLYDPSSYLAGCQVPMLFVNGTNDKHFPLDSFQKSFDLLSQAKQMRVEVNMRHSMLAGWAPPEIGRFIDSYCAGGSPLPRTGKITREEDHVRLSYAAETCVMSAQLHYTTDSGPRVERVWKSQGAHVGSGFVTAPVPPPEANTWFITLIDEHGGMVSSEIQFVPGL